MCAEETQRLKPVLSLAVGTLSTKTVTTNSTMYSS